MIGKRLIKTFSNLEDCPPKYSGHLPNRFVDISGKTYSQLKVLYLTGFRNNGSEWLCKCLNCGNYVIVNSHDIRSGHTKTCGCLASEKLKNDITGKVFNRLEVLSYDKSKNEHPYWIVRCLDCGKIYSVSGDAIYSEQYNCECTSMSRNTKEISNNLRKWAESIGRKYEEEKTFEDCVFRDKLKFDFYLGKYIHSSESSCDEVLIEYDRQQHYKPVKFSNVTDETMYKNFITNLATDWCKDFYCITHNLNFIRIKYPEIKNPNFEELLTDGYIVGDAQSSNSDIDVFDVIDADFVNYMKPTFNILSGVSCTFKCGYNLCQNSPLNKQNKIRCNINNIINKYLSQDIASSITFQGLEPLDNMKQLLWFIYYFRKKSEDTIIIWTGYTKEECEDFIYLIRDKMKFKNIIIKFGRYVPDQEKHYDDVLGVWLASPNQFAEVIS